MKSYYYLIDTDPLNKESYYEENDIIYSKNDNNMLNIPILNKPKICIKASKSEIKIFRKIRMFDEF